MTSLDDDDLVAVGQVPPVGDQVRRLATLAQGRARWPRLLGHEIARLRQDCGPDFKLVVPGLRPASFDVGDQKRVMTPGEAALLGADFLVSAGPSRRLPIRRRPPAPSAGRSRLRERKNFPSSQRWRGRRLVVDNRGDLLRVGIVFIIGFFPWVRSSGAICFR